MIRSPQNRVSTKTKGFTLTEILVAVSIIAILASITLASLNGARTKARDVERVTALDAFKKALAMYYIDNRHYPPYGGAWPPGHPMFGSTDYTDGYDYHNGGIPDGFVYYKGDGAGGCTSDHLMYDLLFDNSVSEGFIEDLIWGGYISEESWKDPLNPSDHSSPYNCRYVWLDDELAANNVQHYLLHCNLEENPEAEANDGGLNDTVYEIMEPPGWICACGQDGKGGPTVSPMAPGDCGGPF